MKQAQWNKLITLISLGQVAAFEIRSNPLPAPQNITWGTFSPHEISRSVSILVDPPIEFVEDAYRKAMHSLWHMKWLPATWEKPMPSYPLNASTITNENKARGEKLALSLIENIVLTQIVISVVNDSLVLQMGVDESYFMNVSKGSNLIEILAETPWGALHALSTLNQIVFYDEFCDKFYLELNVQIKDWPLYPHRGVLIDSGRNFLTIESILDQIDILALAKMNVLHWHLVDSQSWPLVLNSYPEMSKDAYSESEVYEMSDIRYIISYGKLKGVRVIPELDMPGHSRAGYTALNKSILACENTWWSNDAWSEGTAVEPPPGQLEILKNETYEVVEGIYKDLSELFEDNIFHVGADELQANCYNYSTVTQEWFALNSSRTLKDLSQYWVDRAVPILMSVPNRRLMMWEDILTSPKGAFTVPQDTILQTWSASNANVQVLTSRGYDVIISANDFLYLDCGFGGWVTNDPRYVQTCGNDDFNQGLGGSWCGPYKTWQRIYNFNITTNLTTEQLQHVLGAEAALWSEQVDSVVLTSKLWPRSAALAENLWSGNVNQTTGRLRTNWMTLRILNFREFLLALGYSVSPLVPRFCLKNPHACDLYRNQTIMDEPWK